MSYLLRQQFVDNLIQATQHSATWIKDLSFAKTLQKQFKKVVLEKKISAIPLKWQHSRQLW